MALYSLKNNLQYATLKTLSLVSISVMSPQESVQEVFRTSDCVCFDVDSTVIRDEGIDELARFCGKGDEVKRLHAVACQAKFQHNRMASSTVCNITRTICRPRASTGDRENKRIQWEFLEPPIEGLIEGDFMKTAEAMGGTMTFQEALKKRLDIIRPSVSQIREFLEKFPIHLTPRVKQLVHALQERGVAVYLVSGGFRSLIEPVAEILGVPKSHIYANRLKFYFNGEYAGFDENEPTSRSGGKGLVIRRLKEAHGYQRLVMVGDGATDAEACPPADGFIGFGGNVVREEVKKKAAWYVTDFQDLVDSLAIQTAK